MALTNVIYNSMYSSLKLAIKYLQYFLTASNGKGHGVHSPFVFEFITKVLNDKTQHDCYNDIEQLRQQLKRDDILLTIEDFGAGSRVHASYKRKVRDIATSSLKSEKFSQLLFRIAKFYKPENILELGTSLGITTAYLASANANSKVITMEGAKEVAAIAKKNFQQLNLRNIKIVEGDFDTNLSPVLDTLSFVDLAFVDGNHRKEPTIKYFEQLLSKITNNSILVFDDVHWSEEMEEAWEYIKLHSSVTLSIDLFFIGIVFFRHEQLEKSDFSIRF
jgi:predicted O-methyltransferase YrrM